MSGKLFCSIVIKLFGVLCFFVASVLLTPASSFASQSKSSVTSTLHFDLPVEKAGLARVPFIANVGQIKNSEVLFYARTFGGTAYVMQDGRIVYAFPLFEQSSSDLAPRRPTGGVVFAESSVGVSQDIAPRGIDRTSHGLSSLTGSDPERWKSDIPAYETISIGEVNEGIELRLRAYGNNIEKIFIVSPGFDPGLIGMKMDGVDRVGVLQNGELELITALGPVSFTAPIAYQELEQTEIKDGLKAIVKSPVSVAYKVNGDVVGFEVGAYNPDLPLIIDPLVASTFLGGGNEDVIRAMAVQSWTNAPGVTNIFIAGYTASDDFPVTNAAYGVYSGGDYDAFVSKFDGNLTNLIASTFLGGSGNDMIYGMAFNTNNNRVVVAGYTESADFSALSGAYSGAGDAFVASFNDGLGFIGGRYFGGTAHDIAYDVAVALNNDVYVTGSTMSTNFPMQGVPYINELQGGSDAFVARFNAALDLTDSTYMGGDDDDVAYGITVQTNDNVFITGYTLSTNFPGLAYSNHFAEVIKLSEKNIFVSKFLPDLTDTNASIYLGGISNDVAYSITLDFPGNVYIAGYTMSTNYPRYPTTYNVFAVGYTNMPMGGQDAVVTKLPNTLSGLNDSTYIGGAGNDVARDIFIDGNTNIHITGWTASSNFPVTANAYNTVPNGGRDVFLSSFRQSLTNMTKSTYFGGADDDIGYAVMQAPDTNSIFVAGSTESGNFPKTLSAYQQFPPPGCNGFISKFTINYAYGTEKWRFDLQGAQERIGSTFGHDGTIYVADDLAQLFAVNTDGEQVWFNQDMQNPAPFVMESCPAVGPDERIYIASRTNLYTINSDGSIMRTNYLNDNVYGSPGIGNDGTVYVASHGFALPPAQLYAIASGAVAWTTNLPNYVEGSPVVGTNGTIYVAGNHEVNVNLLYSFSPGGVNNWTAQLATNTYGSPAIGSNGSIYVASGGKLFSISNSGQTNWVNNLGAVSDGKFVFASPIIGSEGTVYVGSTNRFFAVHGTTGQTNHTWTLAGKVNSSAAIGEDGSVYVGGGSNLYSLDSINGTTNWVFNTGGLVGLSSPLVGSDGTIYMAGGTNLYAIWGKEALADSPWPTYHHDQHRTRNAALGAAVPAAPASVTASIAIHDRIRVSWNSVPSASLYEVWRSSDANVTNAVYLGSSGALYYDDGFVPIGYNYYYWVRAKNALRAGPLSSPGVIGGRPTIPPSWVDATKGFPTNQWQDQVRVWWPECSGTMVGYNVYRSTINNTNTAAWIAHTTNVPGTNDIIDSTLPRGITNFYWVNSHNLTTTSALSSFAVGGRAPSSPFNVTVDQGTIPEYLSVSWTAPPGSPIYRLYRGTSTTFSATVECLNSNLVGVAYADGSKHSVIPVPLRPYTYWVMATNEFGVSSNSVSGTGFRALYPPAAVSATKGEHAGKIEVSWTTNTLHPSSYVVFRNTIDDSGTAQEIGEVEYLSSTHTNYPDLSPPITRGLKYYYWVKSQNDYGRSPFGPSDFGGTVPISPLNLVVSTGEFVDKVEVTWSASVGASSYKVFRNTNVDSSGAVLIGTTAAPVYDDIAIPGVRYYYWVKAINVFGESGFSGFDSGWRDLAPPTGLTATDGISTSQVDLVWNASDNATMYDVWRNTNSESATARELESDLTLTSYSDTLTVPGQVYYYWVRARNSEFSSGLSSSDSGFRSLGYLDIGVSDFVFLPAITAPGSYPDAVSFKITNYSDYDMYLPDYWVKSEFYLSNSLTNVSLGNYTFAVSLNAGESSVITLPLSARSALIMPNLSPGAFNAYVFVNHVFPSTWLDVKLSNNTGSRFGGAVQVRETLPVPFRVGDFSGDGKADLAVYHEVSGAWYVRGLDGTFVVWGEYLGGSGYQPVAGDFNGNGKVDMAVYHEDTGLWYIRGVDGSIILWGLKWGGSGYKPVWGDYNGDGAADLCVYHENSGRWYVSGVAGNVIAWNELWGGPGFMPAPGDYNGSGKTDFAVFAQGAYNWFIRDVAGSVVTWGLSWGGPEGFIAVPGDYNGDGTADLAVYHEHSGYWFVMSTQGDLLLWGKQWGGFGYKPVSGDFDGDGKSDLAIYNEADGLWYVLNMAGEIIAWDEQWGGPGYIPISLGQ